MKMYTIVALALLGSGLSLMADVPCSKEQAQFAKVREQFKQAKENFAACLNKISDPCADQVSAKLAAAKKCKNCDCNSCKKADAALQACRKKCDDAVEGKEGFLAVARASSKGLGYDASDPKVIAAAAKVKKLCIAGTLEQLEETANSYVGGVTAGGVRKSQK